VLEKGRTVEPIVWKLDVKERNILHTIKLGKAKWIGYILSRNCLLKRVIERGEKNRR